MPYRDEREALRERLAELEREIEAARAEADRHRRRAQRLEAKSRTRRLGRGAVLGALGGMGGLLLSSPVAAASGNLRLFLPGLLLGALFGGLVGLAQDIDRATD